MRRLALTLTVALGLMALSTPAAGVAGFGDVVQGRFYTEAVQWMVDNEITTGTSPICFSPDESVTRGQAAAFLWRMEGSPAGAPQHPFGDVIAPWQQKPVSWMYAEGITTGTSSTTYSPDDTLTRGQMAALMWRAAGEPPAAATTFADVHKAWQVVPVGWMEAENITTGTSATTFSPEDPVTRGQFATFAWRWKGEPEVVVDEYTPLCGGIDNFDGTRAPGWITFEGDNTHLSLDDHPGYVAMAGSTEAGIGLDRTPVAPNYMIETRLTFRSGGSMADAGLQSGNGPDFVLLVRGYCTLDGCSGDAIFLSLFVDSEHVKGIYTPLPADAGDDVYLGLRYSNGLWVGTFSLDGTTWQEAGQVSQPIDDATYGVYTYSATAPAPIALFDWFRESAR